jgi:hypothetical protein
MLEKLINLFGTIRPETIKRPLNPKPRFPCPFYGFVTFTIFADQNGNQCPLMEYTCQMEHCPSGPDWIKCSFNCEANKETIKNILNGYRIAPNEFWPKNCSSWDGIPFKVWMDYVMDPTTPRPTILKMSKTPAEAGNNH